MYELHVQHAICKRSALGPAAVLAIRQKSGRHMLRHSPPEWKQCTGQCTGMTARLIAVRSDC